LKGLVAWKVEDAPKLLDAALKIPAHRHTIAITALDALLETPDSRARELAALYSRYGQPTALRITAVGTFPRLARNDPALQDLLVNLIDDPDASVRQRAISAVRDLKLTRALPVLRARLGRESSGFSAGPRRRLQEAIDALQGTESTAVAAGADDPAKSIAELEAQAAELEVKARDLRGRITELKRSRAQAPSETAPKRSTPGAGTSH
jgi:HEAT repeat protein